MTAILRFKGDEAYLLCNVLALWDVWWEMFHVIEKHGLVLGHQSLCNNGLCFASLALNDVLYRINHNADHNGLGSYDFNTSISFVKNVVRCGGPEHIFCSDIEFAQKYCKVLKEDYGERQSWDYDAEACEQEAAWMETTVEVEYVLLH